MMNKINRRYIDLLKSALTDLNHIDRKYHHPVLFAGSITLKQRLLKIFQALIRKRGYEICLQKEENYNERLTGKDHPFFADTMIGIKRLDNIEYCIENIIENNIQGDFLEAGVWRGGAAVFMRALLEVHNDTKRVVWAADSFKGLPKPNPEKYIHDRGDLHYTQDYLKVGIEEVKDTFKRYHLLDERVKFLEGWFKDTMPSAPVKKLSLLRLDGDMYESTMDSLIYLYPVLSIGGYIIIDDYGAVEGCRKAVDDFRKKHTIREKIEHIDWTGIYWKKTAEVFTHST